MHPRKLQVSATVGLVLLLILFSFSSANPSWQRQSRAPKSGGWGQSIVSSGNNIYLVRCMYANSEPKFWKYDCRSGEWVPAPTEGLPQGAFRNGTSLTQDRHGSIYALLGARYSDSYRRLFYKFEVQSNSWKKLPQTPHAQGAGNSLTYSGYDNRVYAFLGSEKHGSAFASFDPEKQKWKLLNTPWPTTDDGASLVWAEGRYLYSLRGEAEETVVNNQFYRYDIKHKVWKGLTEIPEKDCGVADGGSLLWTGKDYIYALGGGCANEEGGKSFYRYSISENKWEPLPKFPCPIGYYTGNRLAHCNSSIFAWQGGPTTWNCGGAAFYSLEITPVEPS